MALSTPTTGNATASTSTEESPLKVLGKLRVQEIKDALDEKNVPHEKDDRKPRLSALYALSRLNLLSIKHKNAADALLEEALLGATERWCVATTNELQHDLHVRGLNEGRWKPDLLQKLIIHEHNRLKAIAKEADAGLEKATTKGKEIQNDDISEEDIEDQLGSQPNPEAMTFLLYMVYTHLEINGSAEILPNSPIKARSDLKKIIGSIPTLISKEQISRLPTRDKEVLNWVGNTFGNILTFASGPLVIPGIDKSITQFVVSSPKPKLHDAFVAEMARHSGQSIILFHGTLCSNLLSILNTELRPIFWTSEETGYPVNFAFKPPGHSSTYPTNQYNGCGVVLGLEATGKTLGVDDRDIGIHTFQTTSMLMVRYVFVLPSARTSMPNRESIEPAMKKAFKQIEESISGKLN